MGKFTIRGVSDKYIEIIGENNHDYLINYIESDCNSKSEKQETISKALFEFCLSSGYFVR